jgi:hypothetical protein
MMLHMLVNTHTAESCAFRSDTNREALAGGLSRLGEVAGQHESSIEGAWVNLSEHTVFALIDAPNGHVVDTIVREAGLVGWTSSDVHAVQTLDAAIGLARAN